MRMDPQLAGVELRVEIVDTALEPGSLNSDAQVLYAELQQFLGRPDGPGKAAGGRHRGQRLQPSTAKCKGRVQGVVRGTRGGCYASACLLSPPGRTPHCGTRISGA